MSYQIVVGLGNPGKRYEATRHNAGFMAIDALHRRRRGSRWVHRKNYFQSRMTIRNNTVIMIKPDTYMNASGRAVANCLAACGCNPAEMIVIHDDLDLPPGRIKLKVNGGTGGHNGLASIIDEVDSPEFTRIRIGIGHPADDISVTEFVLSGFETKENKTIFIQSITKAAEAVESIFHQGLRRTMSAFNRVVPDGEKTVSDLDGTEVDSLAAKALRKGEPL